MCEDKDIEQLEWRLIDYKTLEDRVNSLLEEGQKSKILTVALDCGPSDKVVQAISKPRVQTSGPQSWIQMFGDTWEKISKKAERMSEEIAECLEKQEEIRMMVDAADLSEKQKLYVQLRYYQGKMVKVVALEMGYKNTERLKKIRRDALAKILLKKPPIKTA